MKLTKEQIDKVRHIEGFPNAKDEDIISLSKPPYYTACPNPFFEDFIKKHGKIYEEVTDSYHREPFAADVSEGRNDPIYNAHSYHTKVPHKAIMRYILHYTDPGDIVYDGFCGTGMTGVAAQSCGNPDIDFKNKIEREMSNVKWGSRKAVLNDLSPAATFISYNYNTPLDVIKFENEVKRILDESESKLGWMYETPHLDINGEPIFDLSGPIMGRINFAVWSDVFVCPNCSKEIVFWDVAVNKEKGAVLEKFSCNHCNMILKKRDCERAKITKYDIDIKENITITKQKVVQINYSVGRKRFERTLVKFDYDVIQKIEEEKITGFFPVDRMMEGKESRRNDKFGLTHVHHFYTRRNLMILSELYELIAKVTDKRIKDALYFGFNNVQQRHCLLNAMRFNVSFPSNITSGTLYLPSLIKENNIFDQMKNKYIKRLKPVFNNIKEEIAIIQTSSNSKLPTLLDNSIDYIFTDPPFGSNLNYSELNFLWEAWLKIITNNVSEAIMNPTQSKGLIEYQGIMESCFGECYRILKPGRWMTVEFHNSKNSVWNAIQEALLKAGFIVADVRTLDKQQGSFKQVTNTSAVKQDLVISAYKPKDSFKRRFLEHAGNEDTVWDFVRQHLVQLPIVVVNSNKLEIITERQNFLLFDRMVAYHIMNGISVPLDATDFYKGLKERFIERESMYFLAEQVNDYDEKRLRMDVEPIQMSLMVIDEKSAIAWLYAQLETPQTRQDLLPKFMQELHKLKHEVMPELDVILNENFIQDDQGRWYVADLNKQSDLDILRNQRLLKDFNEYVKGTGKLKFFRTEAIRTGFDHAWKHRDFAGIVNIGKRLPESVIQEDPALLMYYDNALSRIE